MSDEALGPFRRDGRTRFATESRHDEAAQRAVRTGATLEFPTYLLVLSLGPVAIAGASSTWWLLGISVLLLLFAGKMHQSYSVARTTATGQSPRRAWVTEDGIFLDGILGPARWDWNAINDARVAGSHVVVRLGGRETLVLPVVAAEAERLVAFICDRSEPRLADTPGRLLFLLAILYATSIMAALVWLL